MFSGWFNTPPEICFVSSLTRRKKEKPGTFSADLPYFSLGGTLIKVMQNQWRALYPVSLWAVKVFILIKHQLQLLE